MGIGEYGGTSVRVRFNPPIPVGTWLMDRIDDGEGEFRGLHRVEDYPLPAWETGGGSYGRLMRELWAYPGEPTPEEIENPNSIPLSKMMLVARVIRESGGAPFDGRVNVFTDEDGRVVLEYTQGTFRPDIADPSYRDTAGTLTTPTIVDRDGTEYTTNTGQTWGNRYALVKPLGVNSPTYARFKFNPLNAGLYDLWLPLRAGRLYPGDAPALPGGGALYMLRNFTQPGGWDNALLSGAQYFTDVPANADHLPVPTISYTPTAPHVALFGDVTGNHAYDTIKYRYGVGDLWTHGHAIEMGEVETQWWLLYEDEHNETAWVHRNHTTELTATTTSYGMTAGITNHPNLVPDPTTGGYAGIEIIRPWMVAVSNYGSYSLTTTAWVDVSGENDPLPGTNWGYQAVIDRLKAYGAEAGRIHVKTMNGDTTISTAFIDVRLEWLEVWNAVNVDW